ncbi:MAG: preprotein translocase subunit SecD [Methanomicrobiales archaeon]|nr:preprotein translocase subunit SecD [Methanomicrobiales archaeon]
MNREEFMILLKDWRVLLLLVLVVLAMAAIFPRPGGGGIETSLQFGLDLEGGSWLQLEYQAEVVGFRTSRPVEAFIADLEKALDADIMLVQENTMEIRRYYTRAELEPILLENGGELLSYEQGVSRVTTEDVKRILEEKLNTLGTRDARVNTLTSLTGVSRYMRVELAGVDMATAQEIVGKQGKFEIRVATSENQTEHVLFGDTITYVGLPSKEPESGKWGVSFTLNEKGASAFREAAITYGAVNNPEAHAFSMILDGETVFSAPLRGDLAERLKNEPIRQFFATTGTGDQGMRDAMALEIHLRAGALPVDVTIAGSGTVSALMGERFKAMSLVAGILALITVAVVVYYRYREPGIVLPMVAINASEVIILLGIARFVQQLDLASIAGIIAVLGTGIDQLVVITDEVLYEGKVPSPSLYLKRLSRALGIIVVSAATVFIAMIPLAVMDLSTLRGFALVTIIGTLIGVLVTRPAYGRVIMGILSRKPD